MKQKSFYFIIVLLIMALCSCSLNRMAVNMAADALTKGDGTVFSGDDDPELIQDALPFALKLYDSLLAADPSHEGLNLESSKGYITYANAFIYQPATMLSDDEYAKKEKMFKRAKKLYLRGRDRLLQTLERKYPGFIAYLETKQYDLAFGGMTPKDVPFLYWACAGWMGAYSVDPFDMDLSISLQNAAALMKKALELDEGYAQGAIHAFYISYYGSLPEAMGGSEDKARYHFEKALKYSQGHSAGPYLSLAESVTVKDQNLEEFETLLAKALTIDPYGDKEHRLANIIYQEKARWLLEHKSDFFLLAKDDQESGWGND